MYVSMSRLRRRRLIARTSWSPLSVAAWVWSTLHDGFVDLQVWRSDKDPGEVLMVSRWRRPQRFHVVHEERRPPRVARPPGPLVEGRDQPGATGAPAHLRGGGGVTDRRLQPTRRRPAPDLRLGRGLGRALAAGAAGPRDLPAVRRRVPRRGRALRPGRHGVVRPRQPVPSVLGCGRHERLRRHAPAGRLVAPRCWRRGSSPFPGSRRNLDLGAAVTRQQVSGDAGERLTAVLGDAATFVRSRARFDRPGGLRAGRRWRGHRGRVQPGCPARRVGAGRSSRRPPVVGAGRCCWSRGRRFQAGSLSCRPG